MSRHCEALRGPAADDGDREGDGETEMRFDAALTYSDQDVFRTMDFEKMSLAELAQAKAAIGRLRLPIRPVPTRRFRPAPRGQRVDFRASMRAAVRPGGEAAPLRFAAPTPSAGGGDLRYLRLDGALLAHVATFHARGGLRP